MTITVQTKDGRLIIHDDEKLVINMGGEFTSAITDGVSVIGLLKTGRVQEFKTDGQFVRDIVGGGASSIILSADILLVRTTEGRLDQYKNGKRIYSSGDSHSVKIKPVINKSSSASTKKNGNIGEQLGEQLGTLLISALSTLIPLAFRKLKEKLRK